MVVWILSNVDLQKNRLGLVEFGYVIGLKDFRFYFTVRSGSDDKNCLTIKASFICCSSNE